MTHWLAFIIAAVWLFHGFYSKLLDGIPRHRQIVGRILGERHAGWLTRLFGAGEVALGLWTFTGQAPMLCALVQTAGLITMNTLEILLARDLLISAWGMLVLNSGFLVLIWTWARSVPRL